MNNYNWCHGPDCHTTETQSRVRGSKGNKVLRTIKIKLNRYGNYQNGIWNHFCNNRCLMAYIEKHIQSIVAVAPRREALETPINDPERTTTTHTYGMNNEYSYNRIDTKIEKKVS